MPEKYVCTKYLIVVGIAQLEFTSTVIKLICGQTMMVLGVCYSLYS